MSSEAITRNDLTAILDEVLPPVIKQSTCTEVELPFTPTCNGLLLVMIRASAAGRAYVQLLNAMPDLTDGYQAAHGYFTSVTFVQKGQEVSVNTSSNIQGVKYFYIPLLW